MIKERFSILNAYYLPNGGHDLLYDSITPVNTFRVIFNHYFGKDYGLLKDRSFYRNIYFNRDNSPYVEVTESAYKDIPALNNAIANGDFKHGIDHWQIAVAGRGKIVQSGGSLKFTQGNGLLWIHAYQNVGYLNAGETYQISITTTDASHNLRLGLGPKEPTAANAYWGSGKIEGKNYGQIGPTKQYVFNAVPTTDGPHYIVISDGGPAKSIARIDDIKFYNTD